MNTKNVLCALLLVILSFIAGYYCKPKTKVVLSNAYDYQVSIEQKGYTIFENGRFVASCDWQEANHFDSIIINDNQ